ncbi:MAG: alpha-L-fucosidase [Oceanipulchritudo sp.]
MMKPWFTAAKLGVFVHWGIYAVGRRGGESWPIAGGQVSYDDYLAEMRGFTAGKYDPSAWADLFKRAGAKYAVLTTKHHDGMALWPTREDGPNIPSAIGCGDLVGPYTEAMRQAGLKVGLYFSHTDWSHMGHVAAVSGLSEQEVIRLRGEKTDWRSIMGQGTADKPGAAEHWAQFLRFHRAQIRELLTDYAPVDLVWFDVHWGSDRFDYRFSELRDFIHELSPDTVINSRMDGYGDYETPEQFIPVYPPDGPWELCLTTNNTWSYTGKEDQYKTPFELVSMFCECLGMGGNLLLNVGPDEHGVIPRQQVELLECIGNWIQRNEEAVHGTQRGLPAGYSCNFTGLNESRDVLYVYLTHLPADPDGGTSIKGIRNRIQHITLLGPGAECSHKRVGGAHWLNVPGTLWIDVPRKNLDPLVSVLKIELDGPLDLYDGSAVEIDQN